MITVCGVLVCSELHARKHDLALSSLFPDTKDEQMLSPQGAKIDLGI